LRQGRQCDNNIFDTFFLASKVLGPFRIIPDGWIFEFSINNMQALSFDFVVKDTPEVLPRALRSRGDALKFDFDVLLP
jgi:hypothetical protein